MSKYSVKFKVKVVKYCIEKNNGYVTTAKHFNIPSSNTVLKWVRKFKKHGEKGLFKNNIKYDGKFKLNVIKYMHTNHLSLQETCIFFNLGTPSIVSIWERIYYEKGPQALFKENRGRKKNMNSINKNKSNNKKESLEEEVLRLRMENEYLKKLNALVQKRKKSQK